MEMLEEIIYSYMDDVNLGRRTITSSSRTRSAAPLRPPQRLSSTTIVSRSSSASGPRQVGGTGHSSGCRWPLLLRVLVWSSLTLARPTSLPPGIESMGASRNSSTSGRPVASQPCSRGPGPRGLRVIQGLVPGSNPSFPHDSGELPANGSRGVPLVCLARETGL
jgi:hypothetical protein